VSGLKCEACGRDDLKVIGCHSESHPEDIRGALVCTDCRSGDGRRRDDQWNDVYASIRARRESTPDPHRELKVCKACGQQQWCNVRLMCAACGTTEKQLAAMKPKRAPTAEDLAVFSAAVAEHLTPMLPGRLRVVTDFVSDRWTDGAEKGFVLWILDERGRSVIEPREFCELPGNVTLESVRREVALAWMRRTARGT
jgi:hypothetical protein